MRLGIARTAGITAQPSARQSIDDEAARRQMKLKVFSSTSPGGSRRRTGPARRARDRHGGFGSKIGPGEV